MCLLSVTGCNAYLTSQVRRQMLQNRAIMLQHPAGTGEHEIAYRRFTQCKRELVRLGYFERRVIVLKHIALEHDSGLRLALWNEVRSTFDPATHPGVGVWHAAHGDQAEQFIVWDTPRNIPRWERIIAKYDVPKEVSGQQPPGAYSGRAADGLPENAQE
jgi:hypothetical protein